MDSSPQDSPWPSTYAPCDFGGYETLENYEPGGFHPVRIGDVYDGRYRVVRKLGAGGFSTVWLARDVLDSRWIALKMAIARDSATYESKLVAAIHTSIAESPLFAVPERRFWAARALAHLHANGLCHGDLTTANIVVCLNEALLTASPESSLLALLGPPNTCTLYTYSGEPPAPHGPETIVAPLDSCAPPTTLLSRSICIIDFDQSFEASHPPAAKQLGTPAKYLAPELCVGLPPSKASDVWALGWAIYRLRSGEDLFFDWDTTCPGSALWQAVRAMGEEKLPREWRETRFDEDGRSVAPGAEEEGQPFSNPTDSWPLGERGEVVQMTEEHAPAMFADDAAMRVPYPEGLRGMVWKPTAVCVDGWYMEGYGDETDEMLKAFPKIEEHEAALLVDLLEKIFAYDPAERITAEEVARHPWFALDDHGH
ncbi:kinase-like protein [Parathielavia hyrcaniae]|uniref:EKC/KEOPS complex subunit BUD32 n=1 Tax=Parathielavia hyrcaniae TaxID=113614 RepID=A0AAN6Q6X3_9PEZI|nr:kinase-like protein [Parathielavia hyrcaniae]